MGGEQKKNMYNFLDVSCGGFIHVHKFFIHVHKFFDTPFIKVKPNSPLLRFTLCLVTCLFFFS